MIFTCPHCVKSIEYKFEKPKICGYCGKKPEEAFAVSPSSFKSEIRKIKSKLKPRRVEIDDEYEDEDFDDSVAYARKEFVMPQVEVQHAARREKPIKIRDIAEGKGGAIQNRPPDTRSVEEVMQEYVNTGKKSAPIELQPQGLGLREE